MDAKSREERNQNPASTYNSYMKQLQQWNYNVQWQRLMWQQQGMMNVFAMQAQLTNRNRSGQQAANLPTAPQAQANNHSNVTQPNHAQANNINQPQPSQVRGLAETTDFVILLILKTIVLLVVLYFIGIDFSFINTDDTLGIKFLKIAEDGEFNLEEFEQFFLNTDSDSLYEASFVMFVTAFYRLLSAIYEWMFIWLYGTTPGKKLFQLKVISCEQCVPAGQNKVLVSPGSSVSLYNSCLRSAVKNIMITFLIPGFLSAFFYFHKRTSYDYISHTIVVKQNQ